MTKLEVDDLDFLLLLSEQAGVAIIDAPHIAAALDRSGDKVRDLFRVFESVEKEYLVCTALGEIRAPNG